MSSKKVLRQAHAGESLAVDGVDETLIDQIRQEDLMQDGSLRYTGVDEALIDQIWQELKGKASRTQIHQLVKETVGEFTHATVTTFLPIFIRRRVREKLVVALGNGEPRLIKELIKE